MKGEVFEPPVDDRPRLVATSRHQAQDDLLDDLALEGLEAARAERRALEAQAAALVE